MASNGLEWLTDFSPQSSQRAQRRAEKNGGEENTRLDCEAGTRRARPRREDHRARAARCGHGGDLYRLAADAGDDYVDVFLYGAHITICPQLMSLLHEKGMDDVTVLLGGIIPEADIAGLKKVGIAGIFLPGTSTQDIVDFIHKRIAH